MLARARFTALIVAACCMTPSHPSGRPLVARSAECTLATSRAVAPDRVSAGEAVTVTLRVSASAGCASFRRPRRVMAVIQPPRPTEDPASARALADAFIAAALDSGGRLGISVAGPRQPGLLVPEADALAFRIRLEGARALDPARYPGMPGPDAVAAALDAMAPATGYQDILFYVAHRDVLLGFPGRWAAVREEAARRGIALITACLGGACDPDAPWSWTGTDYGELAAAVSGPLLAGAPTPLRAVAGAVVEEVVDPAFGDAVAVEPAPDRVDGRVLRWTLPLAAGETVVLRYRVDAVTWGARQPAAGTVRWRLGTLDAGEPVEHAEHEVIAPTPVMVQLPRAEACELEARRDVHPARVRLGDPVTVTIGVRAGCQGVVPLDVVMVLDVSGSMESPRLTAAQDGLVAVLDRLAALPARVGLVTFDTAAREQIPLSGDLSGLRARVLAQASTGGGTRLATGLRAARVLLEARDPASAALVIVAADGQSPDVSAVDEAARAITAAGAGMAVICPLGRCLAALRAMASDPSLVFEGDDAAGLVRQLDDLGVALADPDAGAVIVEETPVESFVRLPGSAAPPPLAGALAGTQRWRLEGADRVVQYRAEPLLFGHQPTLRYGAVHLRGWLGVTRTVTLSDPGVETYVDDGSGPCQVSPRRMALPERVGVGELVTVTMSMAFTCPGSPGALDAVLVVDHSDSMRSLDRLVNAKSAVAAFVSGLPPDRSRLGLVAFSDRVTRELSLTDDLAAVNAAVDGLRPEGGTAIGAALRRAGALMAARRPGMGAAVILLTDGREPSGGEEALRAAARALTDNGIELVTVCAGDCGPDLAGLASRPALAFEGVESAQLVGLFARLVGLLADLTGVNDLVVRDGLPSAVVADPGAYAPPPESLSAHEARWRVPRLSSGNVLTMTYAVRPLVGGRVAISRFARVDYRLGLDRRGHAWFPIPIVDVHGPTATPTSTFGPPTGPTATPVASATPTAPTTTPTPHTLWLPRALAGPGG